MKNRRPILGLPLLGVALYGALVGPQGRAQQSAPLTDPTAGSDTSLEEVTVTASRASAERLLDVPESITVISPETLAREGAISLPDIAHEIPSLNLEEVSQGLNRIDMRGLVGTRPDFTLVQERSLVAVYLDDTPITLNVGNPELRAVDLERIEVLRGPQGTLYGAGSMAGTIRYVSRKPDPTDISGAAEVQAFATEGLTSGWEPGYSVRGIVNLPLVSDRAALLLSAYTDGQGGYVTDLIQGPNRNNSQSMQSRAALRLTPDDHLTVDASVMFLNLNVDGVNQIYRELDNQDKSLTAQTLDDNLTVSNLTVNYAFSPTTSLVSSTSYVHRDLGFHYNLEALIGGALGAGRRPADSPVENLVRNFTQEIRMISHLGPLKGQVGFFYGHDRRTYDQNAFYQGLDALVGAPSSDFFAPYPNDAYYALIRTLDEQEAVFAEGTIPFGNQFEVTAGVRYFNYHGPASYVQGGLFGVDVNGTALDTKVTENSSGANPRIVFRYKPSDNSTLFAEAARGFRYGGVNYPVPLSFCGTELASQGYANAPATFGPDSVWTYTLGEKAQLAEQRVAVNADLFYISWRHSQIVHPLVCGFPFDENSGPITSKGAEIESQFRITDHVDIGGSGTYTHATSDDSHPNSDIQAGDRVPFFPVWEVTLSVGYHTPIGAGTLYLRGDYSYRSAQNTMFDTQSSNNLVIPVFHDLGASLTYHLRNWEVGLFGRNLTNSVQINNARLAYPGDYGNSYYAVGRPLTVGARVQRSF